ncbi:MAG TPA: PQQ-dependent sugar dehydrogenase, partial [Pseudobdellovibrionaceae bacterium]|nr:PQQ-dependent sugar dehydrogenase [Pseudobdellovibrionaceae bacterium]
KHLGGKPSAKVLSTKFPTEIHHGWKHIEIGPDGLLYVPVGAPCNICLSNDRIYASLARMTPAGKNLEVIAHGIRNTLGFDWNPKTKELWFTDNGRDLWGDDRPGDELNRLEKTGAHFGYPFCHDRGLNDPEFGKDKDCTEKGPYRFPALRLDPHVAALGIKFYRGSRFPSVYKGKLFVAEHGSWNRSNKIGYRVMTVDMSADGRQASNYKVFAEGWLQGESAWGRPTYLLELPDGSFLLSDDAAGVIYRISYEGGTSSKK